MSIAKKVILFISGEMNWQMIYGDQLQETYQNLQSLLASNFCCFPLFFLCLQSCFRQFSPVTNHIYTPIQLFLFISYAAFLLVWDNFITISNIYLTYESPVSSIISLLYSLYVNQSYESLVRL